MKYLSFAIFILLISSCNVRPENAETADSYFNLEDVLNREVDYLLAQNAGLEKALVSNGETETVQLSPQSKEEWKEQLRLFFDANIDKPGLKDAYYEEQLSPLGGVSKTIYTARSTKVPVQTFECLYANDVLSQINIELVEKNVIFSNLRSLKLYFDAEGQHIIGFDVEGNEDMHLKEEMHFNIHAVVTY